MYKNKSCTNLIRQQRTLGTNNFQEFLLIESFVSSTIVVDWRTFVEQKQMTHLEQSRDDQIQNGALHKKLAKIIGKLLAKKKKNWEKIIIIAGNLFCNNWRESIFCLMHFS